MYLPLVLCTCASLGFGVGICASGSGWMLLLPPPPHALEGHDGVQNKPQPGKKLPKQQRQTTHIPSFPLVSFVCAVSKNAAPHPGQPPGECPEVVPSFESDHAQAQASLPCLPCGAFFLGIPLHDFPSCPRPPAAGVWGRQTARARGRAVGWLASGRSLIFAQSLAGRVPQASNHPPALLFSSQASRCATTPRPPSRALLGRWCGPALGRACGASLARAGLWPWAALVGMIARVCATHWHQQLCPPLPRRRVARAHTPHQPPCAHGCRACPCDGRRPRVVQPPSPASP